MGLRYGGPLLRYAGCQFVVTGLALGLLELGVLGVLVFVGVFVYAVRLSTEVFSGPHGPDTRLIAVFTGLMAFEMLIAGGYSNPWFLPGTAQVFWVCLGLLISRRLQNPESRVTTSTHARKDGLHEGSMPGRHECDSYGILGPCTLLPATWWATTGASPTLTARCSAMRIVVASKFWYLRGGLERVMFDEVELLAGAGHEVAAFSTTHPSNVASPWEHYFAPYIELGAGSEPVTPAQKMLAAVRMFENSAAARYFARLLDDFVPDVVHIHGIHRQISPSILRETSRRRIPVVQALP